MKGLVKSTAEHLWQVSKTSLLTWCISTYAQNNKPVTILSTIGRRNCDTIMKEKHHCHTNMCAFICLIIKHVSRNQALISRHQNRILRSPRNQIRVMLLHRRQLRYFRGSCFSSNYQWCPLPLNVSQSEHHCSK